MINTVRLRPYQARFRRGIIKEKKNEGAFVGGIRSGKTFEGAMLSAELSAMFPGTPGIIAANTIPQLRDSTMVQAFQAWNRYGIRYQYFKSEKRILMNGSPIFLKSTENIDDSIRGLQAGWIWFDEASYGSKYEYDVLVGRLELEPNCIFLTMTGKGKNWVHQHFVEDLEDNPELAKTRFIISGVKTEDNTNLSERYLDLVNSNYSGNFARQELGGELVTMEGAVYNLPDSQIINYKHDQDRYHDIVIDFGFRRPAVLFMQEFEVDGRKCDICFDAILPEKPGGIQIDSLCDMIKARGYREPVNIYADPSGNQGDDKVPETSIKIVKKEFPNSRVRFTYNPSMRSREVGIMIVCNLIDKGRLYFSKNVQRKKPGEYVSVVGAVRDAEWEKPSKLGELKRGYVKEGTNEHPNDCIRYWAINKYPLTKTQVRAI